MTTRYTIIDSPVGKVWVAWCQDGLVSVGFADQAKGAQIDPSWDYDPELRCEAKDIRSYPRGTLYNLAELSRGAVTSPPTNGRLCGVGDCCRTGSGTYARRIYVGLSDKHSPRGGSGYPRLRHR